MAEFIAFPKDGIMTLQGTKETGNFAARIIQCATSRGGQTPKSSPPTILADWTYSYHTLQDLLLIPENRFTEMRSFLEQIYGEPNLFLGSQPSRELQGCTILSQSVSYARLQIGVALSLFGDSKQTLVKIIGVQKV
jgi:hypothetical protein